MPTKTVVVGSAVGLHARPAAIIADAAGELDSEVTLAVAGEEPVDAASSLLIMTLGASFITEGAIPFAAADPARVIPPIMLGSAVTGGLSMALHVGLRAPHGGIFVLFAVTNILGFLIALLVGVLVAAAGVIMLKSLTETTEEIDNLSYSATT